MHNDTIVAISTPPGTAGIGIVRISGPQALNIARTIFHPKKKKDLRRLTSHTLHLGNVVDPQTKSIIDEVLLTIMKAPRTYTKEDVVEINCHSGIVVVRRILEIVLNCGARLAEPGEFTKRAFLSGRIDLSQAEAVMDIVHSKTQESLEVAVHQLTGRLKERIGEIDKQILSLLAAIEVEHDYPEEYEAELSPEELSTKVSKILDKIEELIEQQKEGKILREGVNTVIAGRPNVGKTSLFNALLRQERAIVSEIPGTTRDIIEDYINLKGVALNIKDTAGLRRARGKIEHLGIEFSRRALSSADLILLVIDASKVLKRSDLEIMEKIKDKKVIVILNKIDLARWVSKKDIQGILPGVPVVETSLINNEGIDRLEEEIINLFFVGGIRSKEILTSSVRHQKALQRSKKALSSALSSLKKKVSLDLIAIDLRESLSALREITGEEITSDLLNKIFSEFCVGK